MAKRKKSMASEVDNLGQEAEAYADGGQCDYDFDSVQVRNDREEYAREFHEKLQDRVAAHEAMERVKAKYGENPDKFMRRNRGPFMANELPYAHDDHWNLLCSLVSNPEVYKGTANDAAKVMKLMDQLREEWTKYWADELS